MIAKKKILFVDDEHAKPDSGLYKNLQRSLKDYHLILETAARAGRFQVAPVLETMAAHPEIQLVLLDLDFDGEPLGFEILAQLRTSWPVLPIIIFTSLGSDRHRVTEAMREGANEYLIKPLGNDMAYVKKCLDAYTDMDSPERQFPLWGNSPVMRTLRANIATASYISKEPVLILGESGVGKESVARQLSRLWSQFRKGKEVPFVQFNAGTLQGGGDKEDTELFGTEDKKFSGVGHARGILEDANGGMLYLDEIGNMPISSQKKLLRVLTTGRFHPTGWGDERQSSFRLLGATNREPHDLVSKGDWLPDFRSRVSRSIIRVPSLSERAEDIPMLADLFLDKYVSLDGAHFSMRRFTGEASLWLSRQTYPANIRDLDTVVHNAFKRCPGEVCDLTCIVGAYAEFTKKTSHPPAQTLDELDQDYSNLHVQIADFALRKIHACLRKHHNNKAAACRELFPGNPSNYLQRQVFDLAKEAERSLMQYPELTALFESERTHRQKAKNRHKSKASERKRRT